jgi:hypothetical protein
MDELPRRIESLAERRIREAMEAGQFDDLPGAGRPLPGAGRPDDEMWWIREWLGRNAIETRPAATGEDGRPRPGSVRPRPGG